MAQSAFEQAMNAIKNSRFNIVAQAQALPDYIKMIMQGPQEPVSYVPTPEERAARQREIMTNNIRAGLVRYGGENLPALQYVPQFVEATQKYPLFKHNPYLLPQLSILETSGGKNITRPNNILNWGIGVPENNTIFAQMTPQEVLERAISGLGERSGYYERFRTGKPLTQQEILDFTGVYNAPGATDYANNLWTGMQSFAP